MYKKFPADRPAIDLSFISPASLTNEGTTVYRVVFATRF